MRKAMNYLKMKAEEVLAAKEMEQAAQSGELDDINKMLEEQEIEDKANAAKQKTETAGESAEKKENGEEGGVLEKMHKAKKSKKNENEGGENENSVKIE
jgi:hypothetical protein